MLISGNIEVHLTKGPVRHCDAVKMMDDSVIAIWDSISESCKVKYNDIIDASDGNVVEPDIILKGDSWERVERGDTATDPTSAKYLQSKKEDE